MDSYLSMLASLFLVDLVTAMTPGPNFLLVNSTAINYGRKIALSTTAGITISNFIWCLVVIFGLDSLLKIIPVLDLALNIGGGLYLIYLGILLLLKKAVSYHLNSTEQVQSGSGFYRGFTTGMLNPKSAVYFGSIFSLFIGIGTPTNIYIIAVIIVCFNSLLWFGLVSFVFSIQVVRNRFFRIQNTIDRIAGTILILFGFQLLLRFAYKSKF